MDSENAPAYDDAVKTSAPSPEGWWARKSWRMKLVITAVVIITVICLAIGLGVGLTVGTSDESNDPEPSSTSSPAPAPTAIWKPTVGSSWQIMLKNPPALDDSASSVTPDVEVYDIDLFDSDQILIDTLRRLKKKVICYFSAGSFEDWRPDKNDFKPEDLGNDMDGWPGEKWLDVKSDNVRKIMVARIQMAADKRCDAIDPDNTDGYDKENGVGQTQDDAVDYVKFLSETARSRNLAVGLKNSGAIIQSVLDNVHFSVNEQCVQYSECTTYEPFIRESKPVFHIEYPDTAPSIAESLRNDLCSGTGDANGADRFSTILKKMDLDGWVVYCNGTVADTAS